MADKDRATIVLFSGDFDKVFAAFTIAGGLDVIGPSKFNFGGIGRWMFKKMMVNKKVVLLPEMRETLIDLGVHFLACKTSMDVMEINREDLIDEVEGIVGAATMVESAANSSVQFFI